MPGSAQHGSLLSESHEGGKCLLRKTDVLAFVIAAEITSQHVVFLFASQSL